MITITDTTNDKDMWITGTVHFDRPKAEDIPKILDKCKETIFEYYSGIWHLDVNLHLLGASYVDGWIDYSIEGKGEDEAMSYCVFKKIMR